MKHRTIHHFSGLEQASPRRGGRRTAHCPAPHRANAVFYHAPAGERAAHRGRVCSLQLVGLILFRFTLPASRPAGLGSRIYKRMPVIRRGAAWFALSAGGYGTVTPPNVPPAAPLQINLQRR